MKHRAIQKLASLLTAVTMLLAIVGFPLPQSELLGDEHFPCRDHGCGCTSALMCKTACCCVKPVVEKPKLPGSCCSAKKESTKQKMGWVIGATECQGLSATWSGLGLIVPPSPENVLYGLVQHNVSALPTDQVFHQLAGLPVEPPPPRFNIA